MKTNHYCRLHRDRGTIYSLGKVMINHTDPLCTYILFIYQTTRYYDSLDSIAGAAVAPPVVYLTESGHDLLFASETAPW